MEVSDYLDENGITWQDLYVADVDLLSDIGTRNPRLRRIPIHLIEEFPGGYDGPARQRMASVGYVEDPRFRFTGPMDMEVGPPGFAPRFSPDGTRLAYKGGDNPGAELSLWVVDLATREITEVDTDLLSTDLVAWSAPLPG